MNNRVLDFLDLSLVGVKWSLFSVSLADEPCSIHYDVSLDFLLRAPPGMFLVERFSEMEVLKTECSSRTKLLPESVLAEIDSCNHSTSRIYLLRDISGWIAH